MNTTEYKVWHLSVRIFHWLNVLLIFILSLLGLIMMFKAELGIEGLAAKVGLKQIHILIGYVFVLNLAIRLFAGFMLPGKNHWRALFKRNNANQIGPYLQGMKSETPPQYLGHNPLGRLAIIALYLLLIVMAGSGLFRAGTDIYYPPFGAAIQTYLAADDVAPSSIKPYDKTGVNPQKAELLAPIKSSIGKVHLYGAYILWLLLALHIAGAIRQDVTSQPGTISAMFSGKKYLASPPVDKYYSRSTP
ncbi:cytochrome b/b6 domain-containing protein [Shewanella sp. NIFS-20-20]|uniref:cytochrome b/b6 domain-containing protein n=1 Tax=Shewanella sp. NIFS-20-20 TaxID=2853806 RepID=UPI001C45BA9B|nr:cytochrome b/b6 domain-containing protein [Shewanella sp. NIFS-20-20]MBV7317089.1 cytochrome b/b6 domain-containing protein [Shewanella sp. NIFS-20-20]